MSLNGLRQNWDEAATTDPWRSILGRPGEGKQWKAEEFFQSGVWEIAGAITFAESLQRPLERRTSLDFGCGAGRLTQALAAYFDTVTGVDVSPAMLQLAEFHNRHRGRCHYVLNESRDLSRFADGEFDFVYSNITLQHLRPSLLCVYLKEFVRVLASGGLLLFDLPSHRLRPVAARLMPGNLYSHCSRLVWPLIHPGRPVIEMYGMRRDRVVAIMKSCGGRLLASESVGSAGSDWVGYRYAVTR